MKKRTILNYSNKLYLSIYIHPNRKNLAPIYSITCFKLIIFLLLTHLLFLILYTTLSPNFSITNHFLSPQLFSNFLLPNTLCFTLTISLTSNASYFISTIGSLLLLSLIISQLTVRAA